MPLEKLGAPPFLTPEDVENNDLLEIVSEPYIVSAEKSKFGRRRGRANVRILRTGEECRWTMNTTTWDRLVDGFGTDAKLWIGKKVKVRKETRNVSGVDKEVVFGKPYKEPQQSLESKPSASPSIEQRIADKLSVLDVNAKKALLETLEERAEASK